MYSFHVIIGKLQIVSALEGLDWMVGFRARAVTRLICVLIRKKGCMWEAPGIRVKKQIRNVRLRRQPTEKQALSCSPSIQAGAPLPRLWIT